MANRGPGTAVLAQKYYSDIGLDPLLTKILKHLGQTRPEKPITAMIELLRQEGISRQEFSAETAPVFPVVNDCSEIHDNASEAQSLPGSVPGSPVVTYARRRRENVFAEHVEEEANWTPPNYPKSEDEKDFIRKTLRVNAIFGNPDGSEVEGEELLINACFSRELSKGDIAIEQGAEGNEWFIVAEGELHCFVRFPHWNPEERGDNDHEIYGKRVLVYHPGMTFGELALLYNAPRAATITVVSEKAKVWVLDRQTFKQTLIKAQKALRNEQLTALQTFPLFEYLTRYEQLRIADALEVRTFEAGERIIQEGSDGTEFYLLYEGTCRCLKKDKDTGEEKECFRNLTKGDYFGEISLLKKAPCAASVYAIEESKCFALPKESFLRLIGPLDEVLRRNMETYTRWEKDYGLSSSSTTKKPQSTGLLKDEEFAAAQRDIIISDQVRALEEKVANLPTTTNSPSRSPSQHAPHLNVDDVDDEEGGEQKEKIEGVNELPDDEE
eukprot:GDKJ01037441.1.p1 GENE.GDKJ01037441.1~~GDKJ01037441.1.p1  ORF type:complete len:497 (-),score=132.04 GDKJ01037441.1:223-1713(-)